MLRIPNPKVRDVNLIQSLKSDQRTPQIKKLHNIKLFHSQKHYNIAKMLLYVTLYTVYKGIYKLGSNL